MKSKVTYTPKSEKSFPKLMRYENNNDKFIVLFTDSYTGTIVYSESPERIIGTYYKGWHIGSFTEFHGNIELSN